MVAFTYNSIHPRVTDQTWMMCAAGLSLVFLAFGAWNRAWSFVVSGQILLALSVFTFFHRARREDSSVFHLDVVGVVRADRDCFPHRLDRTPGACLRLQRRRGDDHQSARRLAPLSDARDRHARALGLRHRPDGRNHAHAFRAGDRDAPRRSACSPRAATSSAPGSCSISSVCCNYAFSPGRTFSTPTAPVRVARRRRARALSRAARAAAPHWGRELIAESRKTGWPSSSRSALAWLFVSNSITGGRARTTRHSAGRCSRWP